MKKLLLSFLVLLGSTLGAMAPKPHLLSREAIALLEALEYSRGANTILIQIPVLDQFKESTEKGSSNHSCVYHAIRNGICAVQASLDVAQEAYHLSRLYDKEHLYKMLGVDGDWRTFIRTGRIGNFTDNLDIMELENLLNREIDTTNPHAALAGKGVDVAYFDYASPVELSKEDFEAFCVGTGLKEIKRKLDAKEDLASLIVVYVDSHDEETAIECTDCKAAETNKETPCCHKIALCEKCWAEELKANNGCPECSTANPGDLVHPPVKLDMKRNGHFISLVLLQVGGKRQYILMDSDTSKTDHFQVYEPLKRLLKFLEGNNTSTELLPRYTPNLNALTDKHKFGEQRRLLKEGFDSYKRSYNEQPLFQKAPKKDESLSFEKKSFLGGVLTALVLYAGYYYYTQHKERAQGQLVDQAPTL